MKTHFILLKITTDGDVPDLADKAAGRIYTASGVRDCVVITPALSLPTCAVDVSGEELWSRDQVENIQFGSYGMGRRHESEFQK